MCRLYHDCVVRCSQTILHLVVDPYTSGRSWQLASSGTTADLSSVWVGPPVVNSLSPDAIAVGKAGTILKYTASTQSWVPYPSPPAGLTTDLTAVVHANSVITVFGLNGARGQLGLTTMACDAVVDPSSGAAIDFAGAYSDALGTVWMTSTTGKIYAGSINDCTTANRVSVLAPSQPRFTATARISTR